MLEPVLGLTLAGGRPQVWRIENLELVPVDSKWLGHFFGGDCYLLLYTYLIGEKQHHLLYTWQVRPRLHGPLAERRPLLSQTPLGVGSSPLSHLGAALAVRS